MNIKEILFILFLLVFLTFSVVNAENTMEPIKLKINDFSFDVELENNSATQELISKLKKGNITVNATDYGNFEKVSDLGFSLPTNDENINTSPGDIVLYQGNQISLFFDSHSWNYTKLSKIKNMDSNQLKDILGNGNIKLGMSLE